MDDVRKDMKHRGNSRLSQVGTKEGRAVSALRPSRRQIRRGRKRMNHDGRGTGTRGPQLPAVGVMLAPAGVDSELCVDWMKPRHETHCSPIIMEPMGLCQFPFSLGATRTRPRRSHDDASAADSVPLISASWSNPCRWWAAVGVAGPSARAGRYSLNLSRGSTCCSIATNRTNTGRK